MGREGGVIDYLGGGGKVEKAILIKSRFIEFFCSLVRCNLCHSYPVHSRVVTYLNGCHLISLLEYYYYYCLH